MNNSSQEHRRLTAAREETIPWKMWGPYLSERQWGTVREDYSQDGNAWNYFTHDQARSRAYKWGEDGLAGISDDRQLLCWALALWNGKDPILKERIFGLANSEANHGEDPKEYYYYLDSTPTHSYMKYLYKYPQEAFPYEQIVRENGRRTRADMEFELIDTGIFNDDRYFDVFVEFAKAGPEDIYIEIQAANRGPQAAELHILPHLWFRNTWWQDPQADLPGLQVGPGGDGWQVIAASHPSLGERFLYCEGQAALLFTNNETNTQRLWGEPNASPYVKDAINNYLVAGQTGAVDPQQRGTKAAAHYPLVVEAGQTQRLRLRLCNLPPEDAGQPFTAFEAVFAARRQEADEFYDTVSPASLDEDQRRMLRQSMAGMLWGKQFYFYDLDTWLSEHNANPLEGGKVKKNRNQDWVHMVNSDIISMPDKWEYPWYAAWDLAFHTAAINMVDPDFANNQLRLMLNDLYLHPNGQIPAYEWNFSDVNPPVHAWATLFNYTLEKRQFNTQDIDFLKDAFHKLMLNFNWWVNRKDPGGRNLFNGGFLGLDNIGVFDRSAALPGGGHLEQADGTAWMAFYSQNMFGLALELARHDPAYEDMVLKFLQHFLWIGGSMDRPGVHEDELWDEEEGFFYDVLVMPDGSARRIKVRSMVGLLPLCAVSVIEDDAIVRFPQIAERARAFMRKHPELTANLHPIGEKGVKGRRLLAVMDESKLRRVLARMLDEERFLSPYGIRSLSRWHLEHPFKIEIEGQEFNVQYLPAESDSGMFGGNSNWRGPVWMPVNVLIVRSLLAYYLYYGDDFKVECPTGSGNLMTLYQVAEEISRRLAAIFLLDQNGRRPVFGGAEKFHNDPHWRDYILFYEYFHGDNGAGLGANHQTGWTGLAARLMQLFHNTTAEEMLQGSDDRLMTTILDPKLNT